MWTVYCFASTNASEVLAAQLYIEGALDPIEFHSEEEPFKDRIDSYQRKTGLTEAVQTGIGQQNGIPVAVGVIDFLFMG